MRSDVPNSISSMQRSAVIGRPLPERTDFGSAVYSWTTHRCPSQQHYGLHRAMFSGNDSLASIT